MKTASILSAALIFIVIQSNAQKQWNPQIGLSFQNLTKPDSGWSYKPNTGYLVGLDARFGKGFYFQPGVFYVKQVTIVEDASKESAKLISSNLRLKTYAGLNIINGEELKVRINAGASFDYVMSVKDDKSDYDVFQKSDFSPWVINGGIAAGVDFLHLSAELGIVNELNQAFKDKEYTPDSKYISYYLTLGFVLGDGIHRNR